MLALRYFACRSCDTVYALPSEPSACAVCATADFDELTDRLQDSSYFAPPTRKSS